MPDEPTTSEHWAHSDRPNLGFMNGLSASVKRMEEKYPGLIPNLRNRDVILIGSDYSGEHKTASHEVLAFVITSFHSSQIWEEARAAVRSEFLKDGRRMSFKQLRDQQRARALIPFLSAANVIEGLLVVVAINKEIVSMFEREGSIDFTNPDVAAHSHWSPIAFEKLLRIVHIVGLFLNGLSREGQDVMWFTDQDQIVPNDERAVEVAKIFETVGSHYLLHDLRNARIATTEHDSEARRIEDLVAIPDLAAGALSHLLAESNKANALPTGSGVTPSPTGLPDKVKIIQSWLADNSQPLRRLMYTIEPEEGSTRLLQTSIRFAPARRAV